MLTQVQKLNLDNDWLTYSLPGLATNHRRGSISVLGFSMEVRFPTDSTRGDFFLSLALLLALSPSLLSPYKSPLEPGYDKQRLADGDYVTVFHSFYKRINHDHFNLYF